MKKEDLKEVYNYVLGEYNKLLPEYRKILEKYCPEQYNAFKEMYDAGQVFQLTIDQKNISPSILLKASKFPDRCSEEEVKLSKLCFNAYDPINSLKIYRFCEQWELYKDEPKIKYIKKDREFLMNFNKYIEFLNYHELLISDNDYVNYKQYYICDKGIDIYIDTDTIHFEHEDIVITDPCYVLNNNEGHNNDWDKCNYSKEMEKLGSFTKGKYVTADTIFGDWSCDTVDSDTGKVIGQFCADAGLVSVFSLKEIKEYNPDYNPYEKPWCATVIKDFTGDICLKTKFNKESIEFERYVEGKGSVNFIGGMFYEEELEEEEDKEIDK